MNKLYILFALITLAFTAQTAPVGSGFSYQGQLTDGGTPANGSYDIIIDAYKLASGGTILASQTFNGVSVNAGLFNIPQVDFGEALYDGSEIWLEISVRTAGSGSFFPLSPRQRMAATPYAVQAEYLSGTGASTNDLLQFDGSDWIPTAVSLSPWTKVGTKVSYTGGRVGIGTSNPNSTLHISSSATDDPFRAQIGGATKFVVKNNGGMSIGINANPPANGLYVEGDAKQNANSNGMMKYLVFAFCTSGVSNGSFTGPALINRAVNNVNSGTISIADGSSEGQCDITFPSNISTRYWQTSITGTDPNLGGHCNRISSTTMRCYGVKLSNGNPRAVNLMLTVY